MEIACVRTLELLSWRALIHHMLILQLLAASTTTASWATFVCVTSACLDVTLTRTAVQANRAETTDATTLARKIRVAPTLFAPLATIVPLVLALMQWCPVPRLRWAASVLRHYPAPKTVNVPKDLRASPRCVVPCVPTTPVV